MVTRVETASILALRCSLTEWLHIPPEDQDVIDFALAVYLSNAIPGDPLWGLIIDASGGGKTELLRTLRKRPDAFFLSNLTEKSLVSGYRDPKHPRADPSLLPKLNGKVLIIKDLSPLLAMRRESRNAILSDLRDAYDGFTDQGRGNVGKVTYESRFSVLAASTLAIERFSAVDQELGERFVKFRMRSPDSADKVRQAIHNIGRDDSMRTEIERAVAGYLESLPRLDQNVSLPVEFEERLAIIADFTARARSHVPRNREHVLLYEPRPEIGTRLGKELGKLLLALAVVRHRREPNDEDLCAVARVAEDCLPPNRLAVLRCLRTEGAIFAVSRLGAASHLPWSTVKQTLEDLAVLGIAQPAAPSYEEQGVRVDLGEGWQLHREWHHVLAGVPFLR